MRRLSTREIILRRRRRGGGMDADAAAYIAAVKAAGVTDAYLSGASMPGWDVSGPAIEAFFRSAKSNGYFDQLCRVHMPIWQTLSACEIDMVKCAAVPADSSPTLVPGGFNAKAGGGFGFAAGPLTLGASQGDVGLSLGVHADPASSTTKYPLGYNSPGSSRLAFMSVSQTMEVRAYDNTALGNEGDRTGNGQFSFSLGDDNFMRVENATLTGFVTLSPPAGTLVDTEIRVGQPNATSPYESDVAWSAIHRALTRAQTTQFLADMRTLWETCTGLTMP